MILCISICPGVSAFLCSESWITGIPGIKSEEKELTVCTLLHYSTAAVSGYNTYVLYRPSIFHLTSRSVLDTADSKYVVRWKKVDNDEKHAHKTEHCF